VRSGKNLSDNRLEVCGALRPFDLFPVLGELVAMVRPVEMLHEVDHKGFLFAANFPIELELGSGVFGHDVNLINEPKALPAKAC